MLLVISPAKTLDYDSKFPEVRNSKARLLEKSAELINVLRQKEPWQLSHLMSISDELAVLNANRYQHWKLPFRKKTARPAIYAFKGDVYAGLDAYSLSSEDMDFAQNNLRILSGLYGLLRPLDLMLPYRLEMGTKLVVGDSKDLYQYWGSQLTEILHKDLKKLKGNVLVNLASNEYFRSIQPKRLAVPVVTPVFKDRKGDNYKVVGFWAKKARGLMVRFAIENRLEDVEQLKSFASAGYYYSEQNSNEKEFVFLRDSPL